MSRQAKDSDNIRRELLNYKDLSSRLEAERFQHREKIAELETRITELSDLLNMELQKGYEVDQEKHKMKLDYEDLL